MFIALCVLNVMRDSVIVDMKEQHLCITFSFIPRNAASETHGMQHGVNDTNQKPNSSPVSGKALSFYKSFEHQKHVGGFVFDCEGSVRQEMFLLARWVFVVSTGRFCSV